MQYSVFTNELKKQTNHTTTENNAVCLQSTLSENVDFFYATLRSEEDYYRLFCRALAEDRELALKIAFWHRDIRSTGMGRRNNFRHLLAKADEWSTPADFSLNAVFHYGRTDDMLSLLDTRAGKDVLKWIKVQLNGENNLVAKWLPRESSKKQNYKFFASRIARYMGWSSKEYRKRISALTNVVEQQMVSGKWDEIDFSHVPSQASLRYKNCFARNTKKYSEWQLSLMEEGTETKVNTATLLPHQIIEKYGIRPSGKDDTLEAMWSALPKQKTNCLVIADTSGSMSGTPMDVSIALGLFFAECNPFQGFLTFSDKPQWHKINSSETLYQKINSIESINCLNTNLEATFELLFSTYVTTRQIPETIVIVSDMQFDQAIGASSEWTGRTSLNKKTFFQKMRTKFNNWDIPFPKIVFWNVRENCSGVPVSFDETGTALVSGYSPAIMRTVMNCEDFDPKSIMMEAVQNINPNI